MRCLALCHAADESEDSPRTWCCEGPEDMAASCSSCGASPPPWGSWGACWNLGPQGESKGVRLPIWAVLG